MALTRWYWCWSGAAGGEEAHRCVLLVCVCVLRCGVQLIMVSCAEELEGRGLGMEGLFRLSGSQDEVLKLKDDFDKRNGIPSLKKTDDHALTGVFKLCLRKMYQPLIPFARYDEWIHTAEQFEAKSDHAAALKNLVPKLPVSNQGGLQYLMAFLNRVRTRSLCCLCG